MVTVGALYNGHFPKVKIESAPPIIRNSKKASLGRSGRGFGRQLRRDFKKKSKLTNF